MDQIIELVTTREIQIATLVSVAAIAAVFTLLEPFMKSDQLAARMKRVGDYKDQLRREQREAFSKKSGSIRSKEASGTVKSVVEGLKLLEVLDAEAARKRLMMAGLRGEAPVFLFMAGRIGLPFVLAAVVGFYVYILGIPDIQSNFMKLMVVVGGFFLGFFAPNIYVTNLVGKRQQKIQNAWPDALDLLLICVESGMSIEAALQKVGQEVGGNCAELAEELGLTTAELSYLQERKSAYINLAQRTGLDGVKAVTTALIQSEKYGTPLGQSLRVMASENRELRMQEAEKKAAALPPKLTVPMIVFFLPVLFVVIMGPAMMTISANT